MSVHCLKVFIHPETQRGCAQSLYLRMYGCCGQWSHSSNPLTSSSRATVFPHRHIAAGPARGMIELARAHKWTPRFREGLLFAAYLLLDLVANEIHWSSLWLLLGRPHLSTYVIIRLSDRCEREEMDWEILGMYLCLGEIWAHGDTLRTWETTSGNGKFYWQRKQIKEGK